MAVVIAILNQGSGVLRHARRNHVGDQTGHGGGPQHFIQVFDALVEQMRIYVENKS